jgi:ectoine hydroxylase-related dioxygenase (phytanoyl-CoA dioxygenase family)
VCGDATRYVGITHWHSDVLDWTIPTIKLVVYLDPELGGNRFLYVPCSHLLPADLRRAPGTLEILEHPEADCRPVFRVTFQRGDAIIFDPRILHAVASECERRQIIFTAVPDSPAERSDLARLMLMNTTVL